MPAATVPSTHVPAMARASSPAYQQRRSLTYGERRQMIQEAARDKELRGFDLRVLLEIDYHYNAREGISFPAQDTIAENLGVERRTVRRAIEHLEELGYLRKGRVGRHSVYFMRGPMFPHHELGTGAQVRQDGDDEYGAPVRHIDEESAPDMAQSGQAIGHTGAPLTRNPEPGVPDPSSEGSTNPPRPEPEQPKANKTKALFDRCDELGVKRPLMRPRDHKALKDSDATGELVADAWAAFRSGRWRDDWVARNPTISTICDKMNAYDIWLERGTGVQDRRRGPSNLGPSEQEVAQGAIYDEYDQYRSKRREP